MSRFHSYVSTPEWPKSTFDSCCFQVAVLVELKANSDEARNAHFATVLEEAGCIVAYGLVGLKTHAKISLVSSATFSL